MNLLILGLSGSGKGTQATLLARDLDLTHISTGRLFRRELEKKTSLGIAAYKNYWGKGKWVPTPITFILLQPELDNALPRGFVLEGWPRTVEQARMLEVYLSSKNNKISRVFYLDTPKAIALDRLRLRAENDKAIGKTRIDDITAEVIQARLNAFKATISPIIKYYEERKILSRVDNSQSIEVVNRLILCRVAESL